MATDQWTLDRLRQALQARKVNFLEKRMFGGNCFMVDDKMVFCHSERGFMVRVNPDEMDALVEERGVRPMVHGGKIMKGFLYVPDSGYDLDADLDFWVDLCMAYNPLAKSSKK
jgi:hypothetical protein